MSKDQHPVLHRPICFVPWFVERVRVWLYLRDFDTRVRDTAIHPPRPEAVW